MRRLGALLRRRRAPFDDRSLGAPAQKTGPPRCPPIFRSNPETTSGRLGVSRTETVRPETRPPGRTAFTWPRSLRHRARLVPWPASLPPPISFGWTRSPLRPSSGLPFGPLGPGLLGLDRVPLPAFAAPRFRLSGPPPPWASWGPVLPSGVWGPLFGAFLPAFWCRPALSMSYLSCQAPDRLRPGALCSLSALLQSRRAAAVLVAPAFGAPGGSGGGPSPRPAARFSRRLARAAAAAATAAPRGVNVAQIATLRAFRVLELKKLLGVRPSVAARRRATLAGARRRPRDHLVSEPFWCRPFGPLPRDPETFRLCVFLREFLTSRPKSATEISLRLGPSGPRPRFYVVGLRSLGRQAYGPLRHVFGPASGPRFRDFAMALSGPDSFPSGACSGVRPSGLRRQTLSLASGLLGP